jgi:hypothetical protein
MPPRPMGGRELYGLLANAEYGTPPSWRHLATTHWVMNLEWYKAIRRSCLPEDADDDARDESKWVPDPGDMILRYTVTVTGDGGAPHLVDGRPENLRARLRRSDENLAGWP